MTMGMFHVKLPDDIQARLDEVDKKRPRNRKTVPWPKEEDLPDLKSLVDPRLDGARCKGRGTLFDDRVGDETAEQRQERHATAKLFCRHCKVRAACATVAAELKPEDRQGIWAGVLQ